MSEASRVCSEEEHAENKMSQVIFTGISFDKDFRENGVSVKPSREGLTKTASGIRKYKYLPIQYLKKAPGTWHHIALPMLCLEKAKAVQKWFLWSLAGIVLTIIQGTCCCMHARHALGTQVQEDVSLGACLSLEICRIRWGVSHRANVQMLITA